MGWKEDNKGAGPWPFAAQPNKWGYLNNPNWMIPPNTPVSYDGREDEEPQIWDYESGSPIANKTSDPMHTHIPCGHWHKPATWITPPVIYDVNIFRVTNPWLANGSIQSIFFNSTAKTLSLVDYFISSPGVGGLELVDDTYLFTVRGTGSNARLLILDVNLNLLSTLDVFSDHDFYSTIGYKIAYDKLGSLYFTSGDQANSVVKLSYPGLVKVGRFYPGSVITGSDGNLYVNTYFYTSWLGAYVYPITGPSWNSLYDIVPSNDHDGPLGVFGVGSVVVGATSGNCIEMVGDRLYISSIMSSNSSIKAIDPNTFGRVYNRYLTNNICHYSMLNSIHGNLYSFGLTKVVKYPFDLSSETAISLPSGFGRCTKAYCISDLVDYIVVGTEVVSGSGWGIFVLDPVSLNIVAQLTGYVTDPLGSSGVQAILTDDNFIFIGENDHISAYEFVDGNIVFLDRIRVNFPLVTVGYTSLILKKLRVRRT